MSFVDSIARNRVSTARLAAAILTLTVAGDAASREATAPTQRPCAPAGAQVAQDCAQPPCPSGEVPCQVWVSPDGRLCWTCCPG